MLMPIVLTDWIPPVCQECGQEYLAWEGLRGAEDEEERWRE
jgi:hypothetical protein